ncbi:hypothetical protein [Pedobacter deserti]|uniref:hypothetical protein n=1 Tax=Pedobacter deserti TaxID=2817382 RepID=UPI00210AFCC5|nr:hypothetical protein [Pedobacter sp. SYSU D00382]
MSIRYLKQNGFRLDENAILVDEIKEVVEDLKLVRQGKLKARPARDLVNEL